MQWVSSSFRCIHLCYVKRQKVYTKEYFNTLSERFMISVRSLQRSEGDLSDPISYKVSLWQDESI